MYGLVTLVIVQCTSLWSTHFRFICGPCPQSSCTFCETNSASV